MDLFFTHRVFLPPPRSARRPILRDGAASISVNCRGEDYGSPIYRYIGAVFHFFIFCIAVDEMLNVLRQVSKIHFRCLSTRHFRLSEVVYIMAKIKKTIHLALSRVFYHP